MKSWMTRLTAFVATFLVAGAALAEEGGAASDQSGWYAISAGIAIGLAAFGGALGQGRAAAAALEGIARNPGASDKVFTPMILALAMTESLVIFSWLIALFLYLKIG